MSCGSSAKGDSSKSSGGGCCGGGCSSKTSGQKSSLAQIGQSAGEAGAGQDHGNTHSDNHHARVWWGGVVPNHPAGQKPSAAATKRLHEIIAKYPRKQSAVMPALYLAQEELGMVTREAIEWVASELEMSPVAVMEVASFYTMYYKKPVGKYHVQVCRTLSCMVRGAPTLSALLAKQLGVGAGEVTSDGMFSFEEVECLGSCGTAPMAQINDRFFENLDEKKLTMLLERIRKEQPDLSLSTLSDSLGSGLKDLGLSEIIPAVPGETR